MTLKSSGRVREYASASCRMRVLRRRRSGLPEATPRLKSGGRAKLITRLGRRESWRTDGDRTRFGSRSTGLTTNHGLDTLSIEGHGLDSYLLSIASPDSASGFKGASQVFVEVRSSPFCIQNGQDSVRRDASESAGLAV